MKIAFKNLLLSVTSVILFFGLAEGLARIHYAPGELNQRNLFEYDKDKVYRLKSNFSGYMAGKPVETNSHGYRDTEIPVKPGSGALRVAVVGDSVSFGHGVSVERTYAQRLEEMLNTGGHDKPQVDVINTAVPGNSTFQEYYDLERVLKFEPAVAIIQFTLNDVVEPYWVFRRFGGVGWDYHDVEDVNYIHHLLKQHSAFYLFLSDVYARLLLHESSTRKFEERAKRIEEYNVKKLIFSPDDPKIKAAWRECLSWLERMVKLAQDNDVALVLMVTPFRFQLELDPQQELPQKRLRDFAARHGLVYIDPLERLRREFMAGDAEWHDQDRSALLNLRELMHQDPEATEAFWDRYFIDTDHLSVEGHDSVARLLYPTVKSLLDQKVRE